MLRVLENPLYYLDNFQDVLNWISARYADLLSVEETQFIAAFGALPQPSRALFVRLVMRKGCLFRASKLNYPEIGDTRAAALPLLATGWVEADPVISLDELFELLLKAEIVQAFDLAAPLKAARKAEQLDALREQHAESKPFSAWHPACTDVLYRIGLQALCDRLRLIYFGNYHQDWSEFVLSDLGVYQYEKVEFSPQSRGFRTRQDIEHYEVLHQCRERYNDSAPADEVLQELAALPLSEDNTWLASRRDKLRFQIAQHLEKCQDWPAAYRAYADCRYPGARGRAIRVLEKDEQPQAAYERLLIALAAPESEAEQQLLLRMAPRLRRKLGHAKQAANAAASRGTHRPAAALSGTSMLRGRGGAAAPDAGRCARVLRGKHPDQLAVRPAVLARHLQAHAGRLLPPVPPWPGRLAQRRFLPAPQHGLCRLPGATGRRQLPRGHPRHACRQARHRLALRQLGGAGRRLAGPGAGLHPGRAPEEGVRAHLARHQKQPQRLSRPDPVLASRNSATA